ncbi:helix-turn-helix transcriptional regulator [Rhizobium sp. TRM96647]|uniref:helix-turn-helix domain-containing protein n=1 Tax=unclassified Rhizobium TaxID=2613769 RepID=UPI0021E80B7B|nr:MULTISPECIES: helix-turn-helix transcriptional regulator [unclassified Rhizobium]MCV3736280.1 helix-turn-helix transcriptional regulator [Rhizobium sp. TRM96647]MCV3758649.1 helix-turn-helix transcriptional regulator [Rhizobium sp. TRM96650]
MEFGEHLKEWRGHRRMSQLGLAVEAGISARHLSFLETGRSRPSEGMILRLADVLAIPARDQGILFSAAGFRPRHETHPARDLEALPAPVVEAIRLILARHDPYPGVVFDHDYNVLAANAAFGGLVAMAGTALKTGDNFLDAYLGPSPLRTLIVNWPRTAADLVHRIRADAWLQGPRSALARRIERLAADPAVRAAIETYPETERLPVLPIEIRHGEERLTFITTLTSFGSAQDALVQGVLIESFFPGDEATRAYFEAAGGPKTKRE